MFRTVVNASRELNLKLRNHLAKPVSAAEIEMVTEWCKARAVVQADWARSINSKLWAEALTVCGDSFRAANLEKINLSPTKFGGGGAYTLLYFLVRHQKPKFVLETGVAAGWSSTAILTALEENGQGRLWSSDAPYRQQEGSAANVGILVPDRLRTRWSLFTEKDTTNLPKIMGEMPQVDFFHYDSDKRYAARQWAYGIVAPRLARDATVIFDDIDDNRHFIDLAPSQSVVFAEGRKRVKYLGGWGGALGAKSRC